MSKILIIHGPNLNLLGEREPDIYGKISLDEINKIISNAARDEGHEAHMFQSNHEGEIIEAIQTASSQAEALIINPAAYTHTSLAIGEAVAACGIPTIEVHLSNIHAREEIRHKSFIAPRAVGQISGFGPQSYVLAVRAVSEILRARAPS